MWKKSSSWKSTRFSARVGGSSQARKGQKKLEGVGKKKKKKKRGNASRTGGREKTGSGPQIQTRPKNGSGPHMF
ncbi:hypothetical protein WR25_26737 [Diploscapter pachys]|uniref:Uncharacterized protein n=1 Tax=Diploscapter pachys TaxID=2018661 RepID=A0A2A2JKW1_9BILA|nr:hypothetical protein WR25_26737 [Diploscapter pachys]